MGSKAKCMLRYWYFRGNRDLILRMGSEISTVHTYHLSRGGGVGGEILGLEHASQICCQEVTFSTLGFLRQGFTV